MHVYGRVLTDIVSVGDRAQNLKQAVQVPVVHMHYITVPTVVAVKNVEQLKLRSINQLAQVYTCDHVRAGTGTSSIKMYIIIAMALYCSHMCCRQ